MNSKLAWPIVIVISAILSGIFTWGDFSGPGRQYITAWFLLICPGMALIRLFRFRNILTELILAIALSLVISTILAEMMVLTSLWSPQAGLGVLIGVSLLGAFLQIRMALQSQRMRGRTA